MRKFVIGMISILVLVMALTGCTSSTSGNDVTILKFAHVNNPGHPYQIASDEFAKLIEERTGGRVIVETFPSGQLGNERELIEGVMLGSIDMAVTATAPWSSFLKELMVFDLPFIFQSREHAYRVLDGELGNTLLEKMKPQGVIGLGYWENGFRHASNSTREVKVPDDLKGLKIRLMENPVHMATFAALGALPTPMAWGDVFTALQQGTIDGMENSPVIYVTANIYEVQKYYSLTSHFYSPAPLIINKEKMESLPNDIQKIIYDTAKEMTDFERVTHEKSDEDNLAILRDKGMTITEVDVSLFQEKVLDIYKKYENDIGKD